MSIKLKRIYDAADPHDGYRVLADRLWPRGISKDRAGLDEWAKDLAPSSELRLWYHADRSRWAEFRERYLAELKAQPDRLRELAARARTGEVTLLYAATDPDQNHAIVLMEAIKKYAAS